MMWSMNASVPQHGLERPFGRAHQRRRIAQGRPELVPAVHVAVEVAQHDERHALLLPRRDPCLQRRNLRAQFGAGAAPGARQRRVVAARLEMHRQDAQRSRGEMQRDIGAAAQVQAPFALHRDDIGIDAVGQAAAHHDADTLHHVVTRHVDGIAVGGENPGGDGAAVHFLDRDNVRIKLDGVLLEQIEVLRRAEVHIGRQRGIAGRCVRSASSNSRWRFSDRRRTRRWAAAPTPGLRTTGRAPPGAHSAAMM